MRVVPIDLGGSLQRCAIAPPPRPTPCDQTISLLIDEKRARFPEAKLSIAFFHGRIPNEAQLAACTGFEKRLSANPADLTLDSSFILQAAGVDTIELEAMTFNPHALRSTERPYTGQRVIAMAEKLKAMGFRLGIHLVPGLPGSDVEDAISDAQTVSQMDWIDHVRIWPALGFQGAKLSTWAENGRWRPWDLRQTVDVIDQMVAILDDAEVPVARIGIQPGQDIPVRATAGPQHPNLRGEIESRRFGKRLRKLLDGVTPGSAVSVLVNIKDLAWAKGTSNINGRTCTSLFQLKRLEIVADESVERGTVRLRKEE